jgi:hypothetical protein
MAERWAESTVEHWVASMAGWKEIPTVAPTDAPKAELTVAR